LDILYFQIRLEQHRAWRHRACLTSPPRTRPWCPPWPGWPAPRGRSRRSPRRRTWSPGAPSRPSARSWGGSGWGGLQLPDVDGGPAPVAARLQVANLEGEPVSSLHGGPEHPCLGSKAWYPTSVLVNFRLTGCQSINRNQKKRVRIGCQTLISAIRIHSRPIWPKKTCYQSYQLKAFLKDIKKYCLKRMAIDKNHQFQSKT